jgi:STE24 endopeptidase
MTVELDPERQREARRYATLKRILLIGQMSLAVAYLVVLIVTGLAITLRNSLASAPGGTFGLVACYFIALLLAYTVLSFPMTVASGWSLPRKFGISVQTFPQWFGDWLKGEGIGLLLGLAMVELVYALLQSSPALWWLIAGIVYLFFVVGLAHLGPIVLLPLFFKLTPLEPSELTESLKELARRAGAHVEGVYRLDLSSKTTAANAALTGLGNTRRIIIGDTLLDSYTSKEIEVVFAHELGHHVHHDIPRMIIEQSAVTLIALYVAHLALITGVQVFRYNGIADVAAMPFLALVLGIVSAIATPLLNWASRRAERMADCYALRTTGEPEAFASTMIRLANQNLAVYKPPRWVEILFYDHPAISDRVEMARRFASEGRCA